MKIKFDMPILDDWKDESLAETLSINVQDAQAIKLACRCHDRLIDALKDVMAQAARHSNPDSTAIYRAKQILENVSEL